MKIKLIFLARCEDIVGQREMTLDVDENTRVGDVFNYLVKNYPLLKLAHLTLNDKYAPSSAEKLKEGDTIYVFLPDGGG